MSDDAVVEIIVILAVIAILTVFCINSFNMIAY